MSAALRPLACACDQDKETLLAKWSDFIEGKTGEGAASAHTKAATHEEAVKRASKDDIDFETDTPTDDEGSLETERATKDEGSPTRGPSAVVVVPPRCPHNRRAAALKCEQKLRKVLNEEEEEDEEVQQRTKRQKLDNHCSVGMQPLCASPVGIQSS